MLSLVIDGTARIMCVIYVTRVSCVTASGVDVSQWIIVM